MKFIVTILFIISASSVNANTLTNAVLDIANLNGTNGFIIFDRKKPADCGKSSTFLNVNSNDFLLISSGRDISIFRELPNTATADMRNLDGTNGFLITNAMEEVSTKYSYQWSNNGWFAGLRSIPDLNTNWPYHLVRYNGQIFEKETSLLSDVFDVSCRFYISNDVPISSAIMCGNFIGSEYSVGYTASGGNIRIIKTSNFSNDISYFALNSSNVVTFIAAENPRTETSICDINGDGNDDLLIGNGTVWNNPINECWAVFGGYSWSGNVQLVNIGNKGVRFKSIWPFNPVADVSDVGRIVCLSDLNDDGNSDFGYIDVGWTGHDSPANFDMNENIMIVYSRTNWPEIYKPNDLNGYNGFIINGRNSSSSNGWNRYRFKRIIGMGDVNKDEHNDILVIANSEAYGFKIYLYFGGPFIKPIINMHNSVNSTNGFELLTSFIPSSSVENWYSSTIPGDANGDGYDDILLGIGTYSYPTNYAYLVYGGQSPSAPPALRTPIWINIGESNSLIYELDTIPTNIIWTGCKKGDDYTLCYTNGARCTAWDIPMGELWFTNSYTISNTSEILSVSYTSTNSLGPAIGFTTLTIEPVPEPITTGIVFLATALIGTTKYTKSTK